MIYEDSGELSPEVWAMSDKDEIRRNLEDAARQLLSAGAEWDAMLDGKLSAGKDASDSTSRRGFAALDLMHATLTPTGQ